jgi:16S rRNA (guanine527-N7)-methyltransferase
MTSREFATKLERRILKADVLLPSGEAMSQLEAYYSLLSRWNARINLTSLALSDGAPATLDRLLVEPLAAARHVDEGEINWIDLGSGGGSPAIPLKVVRPRARLTLVEATTKKATFLKEVIRELQLANAVVENSRIEGLEERSDLHGSVHLVTARAVRMTGVLLGVIRLLLAPEGRLHLYATRSPELPDSSGFRVEAVHKLGNGLETRLVVLAAADREPLVPRVPRGTKKKR